MHKNIKIGYPLPRMYVYWSDALVSIAYATRRSATSRNISKQMLPQRSSLVGEVTFFCARKSLYFKREISGSYPDENFYFYTVLFHATWFKNYLSHIYQHIDTTKRTPFGLFSTCMYSCNLCIRTLILSNFQQNDERSTLETELLCDNVNSSLYIYISTDTDHNTWHEKFHEKFQFTLWCYLFILLRNGLFAAKAYTLTFWLVVHL